jgi:O-antigen/teichoic acid export membrane protein
MKKAINSPFLNILRLSIGDFVAKTLNFLAFLYLARILGVTHYGVFEFAISILTYFMLLADGGLEFWATREAAQGEDVSRLVSRIVPLRMGLAVSAFILLLLLLPLFPAYPGLRTMLVIFGVTLLIYAANIKWVFMGHERMSRVALGLVINQIIFSILVFLWVRKPEQAAWVPLLWLAGDLTMALYFWGLYARTYHGLHFNFTLRGATQVLRPALVIGSAQAMGLMAYNFDAVLLGFLLGPDPVGLYRAAYKPITAALAMPLTYFLGLFPALSRTFTRERGEFDAIVQRSLRLTAIIAFPLGIGGTFFAAPIISLLYGAEYAPAIPAMQLLVWSAALIILRDTFRQALIASGNQKLDLRSAMTAVGSNVVLNFILIPRYSLVGAAVATVISEVVWLSVSLYLFSSNVSKVNPLSYLTQPVIAALLMAVFYLLARSIFWPLQAALGVIFYFMALYMLGERELRGLLEIRRA